MSYRATQDQTLEETEASHFGSPVDRGIITKLRTLITTDRDKVTIKVDSDNSITGLEIRADTTEARTANGRIREALGLVKGYEKDRVSGVQGGEAAYQELTLNRDELVTLLEGRGKPRPQSVRDPAPYCPGM